MLGCRNVLRYFIVFFFQAEDGIRDLTVTGVQTCALPICAPVGRQARDALRLREPRRAAELPPGDQAPTPLPPRGDRGLAAPGAEPRARLQRGPAEGASSRRAPDSAGGVVDPRLMAARGEAAPPTRRV